MSHSASSKKTTMMLFTLRGSSGSASAPLHTPWSWPGSPWQAAPSGKTSLRRPLAFENTFCQLWVLTEIAYFASQVAKTTSSQASSKTGSAWTIKMKVCQSSSWWKWLLNEQQNNFLSHPRLIKLINTKQLFVNLHLPVRSNLSGVEQPIERVLTLPPECQLQQNQQ